MNITAKKFLKYTLLPGFRPRIVELFFSGFHYIPFFIALVYQSMRLLPAGHPYVNPANLGRFGVRHVLAEAAGNIEFNIRNIDQILLFALVLVGMGIVMLQVVLLGFYAFAQPVAAAMGLPPMPTTFSGYFVTEFPGQDLAHIMLDMVFGVPDMFNSCVDEGIECTGFSATSTLTLNNLQWPWPAHQGLHAMFRMYSIGLLVIAVLITSYFIATILLETAQTGTAFGKRFNKVWAPVRIVVAFGLLVPMGVGLNSAQYIVLYTAKMGSAFATNGWVLFNTTLDTGELVNRQSLVSVPKVPEVGGLLQFLFVARTCAELAEIDAAHSTIRKARPPAAGPLVQPYFVKDSLAATSYLPLLEGQPNNTYSQLLAFVDGAKQVSLRFGILDAENAADQKGKVAPLCGELNIPFSDPRKPHIPGDRTTAEKGAEVMQRYYLFAIEELWYSVFQGEPPPGYDISAYLDNYPENYAYRFTNTTPDFPDSGFPLPNEQDTGDNNKYAVVAQGFYERDMKAALGAIDGDPPVRLNPTTTGLADIVLSDVGAVEEMKNSTSWGMQTALLEKGWAGAGIWYNRIADLNGAVTAAALSIPTPIEYPKLMELVKAQKRRVDQNVPIQKMFEPSFSGDQKLEVNNYGDKSSAVALWEAFNYWTKVGTPSTHTTGTSNAFVNIVNALFGTSGLYSMRDNPDVHPLAQLVGIGRSLIEAAIRNIGISTGVSLGVGVVSFITQSPIPLIPALISFVVSITIITMTMGFILFYVLPFLPFIYFFFSVGGWVKAIFEAMVGMPLWALAHIRIDKDGLAGAAAKNGYFLLFEIFLRPILIVFGLLASVSIFAAIVSSLNQTWELIVYNVGGFDVSSEVNNNGPSVIGFFRSSIDEFFYTVIYTILVYMMAMSSFKLIDMIPANILRWMGESVQPFTDTKEDAAESLMSTATIGGQQAFSSIGGSLGKATDTISNIGAKNRPGG
ncbi:MAG: DotA/TraY family protein [Alphaproteobacteria bacterium]